MSLKRNVCAGVWAVMLTGVAAAPLHAQGADVVAKPITPAVVVVSTLLEGSWDITITTTPNPPFAVPFRILRTVTTAGIIDAYAFPSITPKGPGAGPLVNSSGHGSWTRYGNSTTFRAIVKYFQLDPRDFFNTLNSVGTVTETITVAPDGDSYTSDFVTEIAAPGGGVIATNPGHTVAKRIQID